MSRLGAADLLLPTNQQARLAKLRNEGLSTESGLHWVLDQAEDLVHQDPDLAEQLVDLCDQAAGSPALMSVRARARHQ